MKRFVATLILMAAVVGMACDAPVYGSSMVYGRPTLKGGTYATVACSYDFQVFTVAEVGGDGAQPLGTMPVVPDGWSYSGNENSGTFYYSVESFSMTFPRDSTSGATGLGADIDSSQWSYPRLSDCRVVNEVVEQGTGLHDMIPDKGFIFYQGTKCSSVTFVFTKVSGSDRQYYVSNVNAVPYNEPIPVDPDDPEEDPGTEQPDVAVTPADQSITINGNVAVTTIDINGTTYTVPTAAVTYDEQTDKTTIDLSQVTELTSDVQAGDDVYVNYSPVTPNVPITPPTLDDVYANYEAPITVSGAPIKSDYNITILGNKAPTEAKLQYALVNRTDGGTGEPTFVYNSNSWQTAITVTNPQYVGEQSYIFGKTPFKDVTIPDGQYIVLRTWHTDGLNENCDLDEELSGSVRLDAVKRFYNRKGIR